MGREDGARRRRLDNAAPGGNHGPLRLRAKHVDEERRLALPKDGPAVLLDGRHDGAVPLHVQVVEVNALPSEGAGGRLAQVRLARAPHPHHHDGRVRGRARRRRAAARLWRRHVVRQAELGAHHRPKLWEGLVDAVLLPDGDARQPRAEHGEGHGDAVVVVARDGRRSRCEGCRVHAGDPHAVLELSRLDAELAELGHHDGDPVALLDALVRDTRHPRGALRHRHHRHRRHEGVRQRLHVHLHRPQPLRRRRAADGGAGPVLLHGAPHLTQQRREPGVALDRVGADRLGRHLPAGDRGDRERVRGGGGVRLDLKGGGVGVDGARHLVHERALPLDGDAEAAHQRDGHVDVRLRDGRLLEHELNRLLRVRRGEEDRRHELRAHAARELDAAAREAGRDHAQRERGGGGRWLGVLDRAAALAQRGNEVVDGALLHAPVAGERRRGAGRVDERRARR
mmetsp:Transcript_36574/g.117926  ORF Transcript_36574/g.117926 Transcript_36574/m.117926 type:complete len:454 (-) Transcript_36574:1473-2834(-)